jgi:hypothetical protein
MPHSARLRAKNIRSINTPARTGNVSKLSALLQDGRAAWIGQQTLREKA